MLRQAHPVAGWDGTGWGCREAGGNEIQLNGSRELQVQLLPVLIYPSSWAF